MDINKVTLIGRLTHAPEARDTKDGRRGASFSVATSYVWKDKGERREQTEFHRIIVWGKLAEIVLSYLDKGRRVYIEGRLVHRAWEDRDGKKQKTAEIIGDEIVMLGDAGRRKTQEPADEGDSSDELVEFE